MKCEAKECGKDATNVRRVRPGMGSINVNVCDEHAADIDAGKPPLDYDLRKDMPKAS
jgi:hypothetical protein